MITVITVANTGRRILNSDIFIYVLLLLIYAVEYNG